MGEVAYRSLVAMMRLRHRIRERCWQDGELSIAYDEAGDPSRPTLICVPGFASCKDYFLKLTAILRKDFHVIVPDLPGFGRSTAPRGATYSLGQYGRWMERFLDAVVPGERGDCHYIGNSLGGALGLELALNRRYPVSSLCLVATGGVSMKGVPTLYDEIEAGGNPFAIRNFADYRKFRERILRRKDGVPLFIQRYLAGEFIRNRRWYGKILDDLKADGRSAETGAIVIAACAFNDRLPEIACPVLVLWGEDDGFFPRAIGKLIADQIPRARLEILPEVGHCPQVEASDEVAALIRSFLPVATEARNTP